MSKLKYVIMEHVYERSNKRRILLSEVMNCLKYPDQVISGDKGRLIYQKIFVFNKKKDVIKSYC